MRVATTDLVALQDHLKKREATVYQAHFDLVQTLKSLGDFKMALNFEGKMAESFEAYLHEVLIPVNELCLLAQYELYRFYEGYMADFDYFVDDTGDCYIDTEELEYIKEEETRQFNFLQNNITIARGPEFRELDELADIYYEIIKNIDETIDSVLEFDYTQVKKLEALDTVIQEALRGLNQMNNLDIKTYEGGSVANQSWNLFYKSAQNDMGALYANSKEVLLALLKKDTGVDLVIPAYLTKEEAIKYIETIKNHMADFKLYGWDKAGIAGYVTFINETLSKTTNKTDLMNAVASINRDSVAIGSDVYMVMLESSKMKDKAKVEMIYNQSTQFGLVLSASLTASSPFFKEFNELVFKSGILQDEVKKRKANPEHTLDGIGLWLHTDFRNTLNNQVLKKYEGLTGEALLDALKKDGFIIDLGSTFNPRDLGDIDAMMKGLITYNSMHNNNPNKIFTIKIQSQDKNFELEYDMKSGLQTPGSYNYGYGLKGPDKHAQLDINLSSEFGKGGKKEGKTPIADPMSQHIDTYGSKDNTSNQSEKFVTDETEKNKYAATFMKNLKEEEKKYRTCVEDLYNDHTSMFKERDKNEEK